LLIYRLLGEELLLGEESGLGEELRLGLEQLGRTQRRSLADYGMAGVSYAQGDWLPQGSFATNLSFKLFTKYSINYQNI
jgi:hypothetical protein